MRKLLRALGGVGARARGRTRPRFLTWVVTFTCNARCIMCDSWKKPSPNDLELPEVERIFRELPKLDGVRLTGGEPFVRKDLVEIADLVTEHLDPLFLHVTTNGFLTPRIVRFAEERDRRIPLRLLVSVDGVGEKHNEVRGQDFAWRKVTETLRALAPRQKDLGLSLSVNQTIVDREGIEHYRLLKEEMRPLGVRVNVVVAYDASATYSLEEEEVVSSQIGKFTTFGEFGEAEFRALAAEIEEDLASFPLADRIAKRYYLDGARSRLLDGGSDPNPRCVALRQHLRMLPDGTVPVCQFNTKRVGDLRRQSFDEVWNGEPVAEKRRWVDRCPGCWAECEIVPNALYSGDLFRRMLPVVGGRGRGK